MVVVSLRGSGPGSSWGFSLILVATVVCLQTGITQAVIDDDGAHTNELEGNGTVLVCDTPPTTQETCNSTFCVRKCCPTGEHLTEDFECAPHEVGLWSPTTTFLKDRKDVDESNLKVLFGFPPGCNPKEDLIDVEGSFQLLPDGRMHAINETLSEPVSRYCLENIHGSDGELGVFCIDDIKCYEHVAADDMDAMDDGMGEQCKFHGVLYPVLMSFSVFFLILTIAVYAGVPKLREKTYGRCLVSLVVALLIFYLNQILNVIIVISHTGLCITLGFFIHWNGLAIFFWLNVMAFELWRTVCSGKLASNDILKFQKYSAYAWGVPFLIAIITVIIHHLPDSYENLLRPNLAAGSCFLGGWKERWAYLYWVIVVITLVNLGFFIHICYTIYMVKQNARKKNEDGYWIFLKMFLIVGISWILEIFSTTSCLSTLLDLPNLLQGVFIFLATVCNKHVLKDVMDDKNRLGVFVKSVQQMIPSTAASNPECNDERTSIAANTRATRLFSSDADSQSNPSSAIPLDNVSSRK